MPRNRIIELFKPAETEDEIKQGGFQLVDDTKVPSRPSDPSSDDTSSVRGQEDSSSESEAEEVYIAPVDHSMTPHVAPRMGRRNL
jgi:hypothetical protein